MAFAALKERIQRVNHALAGHRFLFGSVALRRGRAVGAAQGRELRNELARVAADVERAWHELAFTPSVAARLEGVGILTTGDVRRLGTVGPAARAAGEAIDLRTTASSLWYPGFAAVTPERPTGDVAARCEMRALELVAGLAMLGDLLCDGIGAGSAAPVGAPMGSGVGLVESPRGGTSCTVDLDGDRVARMRLRTGSYANWPSVAQAAAGEIMPEFPLINKSFELCYACVDR
jgi:Ni,Fe-hydrogenase III large subunit